MLIINVRDNENNRWKRNAKEKRKKKNKEDGSYSEWVRDKSIRWAFKSGFLQLICKASLIFKSNLESALSIILKEENYESKHVAVEFRFLKIWDLLSFLICSSILVFKSTSFSNSNQQLGLYMKKIIFNEVKWNKN